ncbi:Hypothetical Protein FCC1311_076312 [Hondaea fermentalgiana]|uniref:PH domain-containing protein n=1 Tax=Hondaea fermentalgiana TaxID=2315210 RepID=A0A2R5GKK0_9STRA|nr:Hypothetical Protein FCC1311_076312 [Hondaea fermentalgiana]|eukprot:GBG31407.1 Hypothetical Protein FCC1311_076312 [Hondaea fermentalgiana]
MEAVAWHLAGDEKWTSVYLVCGDGVLSAFEEESGEPSIPLKLAGLSSNELELGGTGEEGSCASASLGPNDSGAPTNFGFSVTKGDDVRLRFCAATKQDLIKWRKSINAEAASANTEESAPAQASASETSAAAPAPAPLPMPAPAPSAESLQAEAGGVDAKPGLHQSDDEADSHRSAQDEDSQGIEGDRSEDDEKEEESENADEQRPSGKDLDPFYNANAAGDKTETKHGIEDEAIRAAPGEVPMSEKGVQGSGERPQLEADDEGIDSRTNSVKLAKDDKGSHSASIPPYVEPVSIGSQDPNGIQTIVIHFEDTEVHISFRNQRDVDRVTVTELKGSLCMKLNAEPDCEQFLRPSELDLLLGAAVLREYWSGRDFGLRGGLHLDAKERSKIGMGAVPGPMSNARLVAQLKIGARVVPVHLRDGEKPEDVAEGLAERLGLDASRQSSLLLEIYRQMSERVSSENASLRNQVGELLHRAKARRAGGLSGQVSQSSQESYEALLDRAAQRIEALEKDKKQLSDQVFELRLVNAERLASLH